MKVVVLGANGLVGSRIATRLAEAGDEVFAVARGPQRLKAHVHYMGGMDLLRDTQKIGAIIGSVRPDGVINAAAMTDVDACEKNPAEAWTFNAEAVEVAAKACA